MTWLWHRLLSDFWPFDASRIAPNILASAVQWAGVVTGTYFMWPRFRRAVDAWVQAHLRRHHAENVQPGHDELHAKLDHLLTHLAAKGQIPAYESKAIDPS